MDQRKLKLLAELLEHLEGMDGEELMGQMPKPEPKAVGVEVTKVEPITEDEEAKLEGGVDGPMDKLLENKEEAPSEDEPSDDELDELEGLFK